MTCETELVAAVEASLGVGPRKWFSRGFHIVHLSFLVGGFNHLENMKVNGKDCPIYYGK